MEIWKNIPNYDLYQASNYGNIKNIKKNNILKLSLINSYYSVSLYNNDNKRICKRVHYLIALTFLPNPENKLTVNHKDHNTMNNSLENLEWYTQKEQNAHKKKVAPEKQKLISSRKVKIQNIITNDELLFDTMVDACQYIYDENIELFGTYKNFTEFKKTIKSRMSRTIRNKLNGGIMYSKYKPTFYQIEKFDNEIWKEIPDILIHGSKKCFISTYGRVKNSKGRITIGYIHDSIGYYRVSLNNKHYYLHLLLATVFIPNIEGKSQVNHINGDISNNSIENLEWNTPSENCIHRSRVLNNNNSLKKVYQYNLDMNLLNVYSSITEASNKTGIPKNLITSCCYEKQVQTKGYTFRFESNKDKIRKDESKKNQYFNMIKK